MVSMWLTEIIWKKMKKKMLKIAMIIINTVLYLKPVFFIYLKMYLIYCNTSKTSDCVEWGNNWKC